MISAQVSAAQMYLLDAVVRLLSAAQQTCPAVTCTACRGGDASTLEAAEDAGLTWDVSVMSSEPKPGATLSSALASKAASGAAAAADFSDTPAAASDAEERRKPGCAALQKAPESTK
jgi:hypothetical protein